MIRRVLPSLLLLCCALAPCAQAKKSDSSAAPDGSALIEELRTSGVDKKRFEAYVKRRLTKINERHKARMDFMAKEAEVWNSFWTKVRDERKLFEIRMTRQTLDLFESLSSLDQSDHDTAIGDFEKMQGNVLRSFETQQKQKLDEFFAARDRRWKDFVAQQERERADFIADAPREWQRTRLGGGPSEASDSGAGGDEASVSPMPGQPKSRR